MRVETAKYSFNAHHAPTVCSCFTLIRFTLRPTLCWRTSFSGSRVAHAGRVQGKILNLFCFESAFLPLFFIWTKSESSWSALCKSNVTFKLLLLYRPFRHTTLIWKVPVASTHPFFYSARRCITIMISRGCDRAISRPRRWKGHRTSTASAAASFAFYWHVILYTQFISYHSFMTNEHNIDSSLTRDLRECSPLRHYSL